MNPGVLLAGLLAASPSTWTALESSERSSLLSAWAARPLSSRLLSASARFLGTPYTYSPLGEGAGEDPDPLLRYDAVDCLTFVEESIALSLAGSDAAVEPLLTALRYQQQATYEDRNHLMEAAWLPNNVRKGFLRDVTQKYGREDVQPASKRLTPKTWTSRTSSALRLPPSRQVTGEFPLNVIPLHKALARARTVPEGTILVVVREDRPLLPTRISHLGFLLHKRGKPVLRHASRTFGRVVDEDLEAFLSRNARYSKWRVEGVSLFEVQAPSRTLSAEAAAHPP